MLSKIGPQQVSELFGPWNLLQLSGYKCVEINSLFCIHIYMHISIPVHCTYYFFRVNK
jgi:hypothetical protein